VDGDGSGEIDASEFQQLLTSQQMAQYMSFEIFFNAMFQLAELWTAEAAAPAFVAFLTTLLDRIATKSSPSSSASAGGGGGRSMRDLCTRDEVGSDGEVRVMYELLGVDEVESFVDAATGVVSMPGVALSQPSSGGGRRRRGAAAAAVGSGAAAGGRYYRRGSGCRHRPAIIENVEPAAQRVAGSAASGRRARGSGCRWRGGGGGGGGGGTVGGGGRGCGSTCCVCCCRCCCCCP
jgi:hypothetical protein